jgi:hypothetical protein
MLELTQQPQLRTPQRMFGVVSALHAVHIEIPGFEIDVLPPLTVGILPPSIWSK